MKTLTLYCKPVHNCFSVTVDNKDMKPNLRQMTTQLAEYLISNGYVQCLESIHGLDYNSIEYRFVIYAYKPEMSLP